MRGRGWFDHHTQEDGNTKDNNKVGRWEMRQAGEDTTDIHPFSLPHSIISRPLYYSDIPMFRPLPE